MRDWSLHPGVRSVLRHIPLPIQLPTPLRRASGPTGRHELEGTRAVLTSLQDDLDLGLALALGKAGAALAVADPDPAAGLLAKVAALGGQHTPWTQDLAGGLLAAITASGAHEDRRPVVLVHRVSPTGEVDPAVNAATDRLFAVGHAAAHQVASSRLLLVVGADCTRSADGLLLAATATGFHRSAFKELGRSATTCHLLRQAGADAATVSQTAVFLAGPRAAFLTGLDLHLGRAVGGAEGSQATLRLHGKIALVTGAARGIGAAIAARLAEDGAHVWVNDIPAAESAAQETAAAIRRDGGLCDVVLADVATGAGATHLSETLQARHGRVDVVVHNAGITRDRTLRKMGLDGWRLVLQVDFGAMVRVQAA